MLVNTLHYFHHPHLLLVHILLHHIPTIIAVPVPIAGACMPPLLPMVSHSRIHRSISEGHHLLSRSLAAVHRHCLAALGRSLGSTRWGLAVDFVHASEGR